MTPRTRMSLLAVLFLLAAPGCNCGQSPALAADGGPGPALRLRMPPEVVSSMRTGLPLDQADVQVLSLIDPANPKTHVAAWQEYENAPGMTMVNVPQRLAEMADSLLATQSSTIPPIERDFAFCDRTETNHEEFPIPTATLYPLLSMKASLWQVPLPILQGKRLRGTLSALRFTGLSPTTFRITGTVKDLSFDFLGAAVHFDSLDLVCPGTIAAPTGTCGDTLIRCVAPTVTAAGYQVSGFLSPLPQNMIVDTVTNYLTAGLSLHFDNFAATSLTLVNNGTLTVTGTPDLNCSPHPEPLPPTPPTRGLVQIAGTVGQGELVGELGDVVPFDLVPEARVEWGPLGTPPLLPFTPLEDNAVRTFGGELPTPATLQMSASANLQRRFKNHCFRPAVTPNTVFLAAPGRALMHVANDTGESVDHEPMAVHAIEAIEQEKAAAFFAGEGKDLPTCEKKSCTWTRIDARLALPDSPLDAPPVLDPRDVAIVVGFDPATVTQLLTPEPQCLAKPQKVVKERRYLNPSLTFYPFQLDSRRFASEPANGLGLQTVTNPAVMRTTVTSSQGMTSQVIWFNERCTGYEPPAPRPANCWFAPIGLPPKGDVVLSKGFSGTLLPQVMLRDVLVSGAVSALGARTQALQGVFDRGALQLFTAVPVEYRLAGVTQQQWDYRGEMYLDWEHLMAPAPIDAEIHAGRVARYKFQTPTPYFTDWNNDQIQLRYKHDAPRSFCTLPQDLFATPVEFTFEGGGLSYRLLLDAADVMTTGRRDQQGRFQAAPGLPVTGDTSKVRAP